MSYKVQIPPNVKQAINSWPVPREIRVEVYNRLHIDLAHNHENLLHAQIVPYADVYEYTFSMELESNQPFPNVFFFAVEKIDRDQTLLIRYCRFTP